MKPLLIKYDPNGLFWMADTASGWQPCRGKNAPDFWPEQLVKWLQAATGSYLTHGYAAIYVAGWIAEELRAVLPLLNKFKHIHLELPKEFAEKLHFTSNVIPARDFIDLLCGTQASRHELPLPSA